MGRSLGRSALLAGGRIKGKEEEEERVEEGKEEESGRKGRGAPGGEGGGVRLTWRSSNARKNLEVPRG